MFDGRQCRARPGQFRGCCRRLHAGFRGAVRSRLRAGRPRAALLCGLPAYVRRRQPPRIVCARFRVPQHGARPGLYRRGGQYLLLPLPQLLRSEGQRSRFRDARQGCVAHRYREVPQERADSRRADAALHFGAQRRRPGRFGGHDRERHRRESREYRLVVQPGPYVLRVEELRREHRFVRQGRGVAARDVRGLLFPRLHVHGQGRRHERRHR